MFDRCSIFDGKSIENWDVSKIKNMESMFNCCDNLNCDLSKWIVSNVKNMTSMFYGCKNFEGKGLENWDVSKVKDKDLIFRGCDSLHNKPSWYSKTANKKINNAVKPNNNCKYFPNTKKELINYINSCISSNNYNLNIIDVSKITDMSDLFENIEIKSQLDVSKWNVSNVDDMSNMFNDCDNITVIKVI